MKALIWGSNEKAYPELYNAAKSIGAEPVAVVIGNENIVHNIKDIGFVKIYWYKNTELSIYEANSYASIIASILTEEKADVILVDSTIKGKILAGAIAGKIGYRVITDAFEMGVSDGKIMAKRMVYGGMAYATIEIQEPKAILAIKPGAYKPEKEGKEAEIVEKSGGIEKVVEVIDFKTKELGGLADLTEAKIVVGAGRGVKKKEDLEMIKEVAKVLGGAWGLTRPLAADYGWAPVWIGVSGVSIKPDLYIAIGISGQPQHISGIRDSKVIVAINNDENAPILEHADYGIVGDLYQIVPKLIEKLKTLKKS